jgi:hypothetical protein
MRQHVCLFEVVVQFVIVFKVHAYPQGPFVGYDTLDETKAVALKAWLVLLQQLPGLDANGLDALSSRSIVSISSLADIVVSGLAQSAWRSKLTDLEVWGYDSSYIWREKSAVAAEKANAVSAIAGIGMSCAGQYHGYPCALWCVFFRKRVFKNNPCTVLLCVF